MTGKKELRLERFQTESISGQKYVSILCSEGALWITAGKGFSDIILGRDQRISLIADETVVIEALESSVAFFSANLSAGCESAAAEL